MLMCLFFFSKTQTKEKQKNPSKNVIEYKAILQIANLLLMAQFRVF